jgi:hypothetical protein
VRKTEYITDAAEIDAFISSGGAAKQMLKLDGNKLLDTAVDVRVKLGSSKKVKVKNQDGLSNEQRRQEKKLRDEIRILESK